MIKKKLPQIFGFYSVLTDPIKGYDYMTELLVDYDMPVVQLRMKGVPTSVVTDTASRMRRITDGTNTRLVINDYPRIAREIGADGVHVGQSDMPYREVRTIIGEDMLIGISTHNPTQTKTACAIKPDYIGIGPVFPTPTKKIPDPAIGTTGMKEMLSISDPANIPAVCIGGIDLNNLRQVIESGAKNFCMVRQFTQSENPEHVLKEILRITADISN